MGAVLRNITSADDLEQMAIPTRPDGSYYRFEMICDGGWTRVYDDSAVALMSHLIPGYTRLDDQQRLAARIRHAVDIQVRVQTQVNGFFRNVDVNEDEVAVLTGPRHIAPVVDVWSCRVPLILVDAFYAPYSEIPRPRSIHSDTVDAENLWWLRPTQGDLEYLRSLHEISAIDLNIMKDEIR